MFVNDFLAPIQVRLSPNMISHNSGHRGRGDYILESQGQRSRSVGEICALLNPFRLLYALTFMLTAGTV